MSARDPAAAVDQLVDPLQRALSCVTPSVLTGRRYHESPTPHVLFFEGSADPSRIGRSADLALAVRHFYRLSGRRIEASEARWQVETVGYIYEVFDRSLARIVAYHWHPPGTGRVDAPHLHVGRQFAHSGLPDGVRASADRLVRCHLPTGPIVLPTVLRMTIAELGARPLRDDWAAVLAETERETRRVLPPA